MNTYWHKHPRGFANECSVARCEDDTDAQEAQEQGYERLTQPELRRHVKWVNGEMWTGQRHLNLRAIEGAYRSEDEREAAEGYRWVFVNAGLG